MAVYKVIQDIESEDKLLGPLTLKQFVYAGIAVFLFYIEYQITRVGLGMLTILALVFLTPIALLFGILASPLGREQPTEVWLLSKVKFFLKPRERTWDQAGIIQLVTITAPKREDGPVTKDFDASEAKSRLKSLAATLDSRGWATKNSAVNIASQPSYLDQTAAGSDRLVETSKLPQVVPEVVVTDAEDVLDTEKSTTAQHFSQLIEQAAQKQKDELARKLEEARQASIKPESANNSSEFEEPAINAPIFSAETPVANGPVSQGAIFNVRQQPAETAIDPKTERDILDKVHAEQTRLDSAAAQFRAQIDKKRHPQSSTDKNTESNKLTPDKSSAIMDLSRSDYSVSVVANEAKRRLQK